MYLNNLNLNSFRAGVRAGFQKKAGIASAIGSGLDWLAPQTTNNFLRPAWRGIKQEFSNPNWSFDSVLNAGGKGIEANRTANFENKISPYGITLNKDQYGALDSSNPLDIMGSIKNMGSNALNWAKNNPGQLLGGAVAVGGLGYLAHSLFSSPAKQAPVQHVEYPRYQMPQYNYQNEQNDVSSLDKYKFGEANPLDFRKYLTLQGAVPLTYNFAKKLPNIGHAQTAQVEAPQLPETQDINVSAEDEALKKLLQKQEMRDYLIKLMQPRIV